MLRFLQFISKVPMLIGHLKYIREGLKTYYWFCRYEAMLRNTFWKFRRMGQVNIFLHPDQKEKLLIHILRKLQKMVWIFTIFFISLF